MKILQKFLLITFLTSSIFTQFGCGKVDDALETANTAIEVLDQGIADITNESTNWRSVLEDVVDEMPATVHNTKSEVSQLLNEGIGATSSNIICVIDAIPNRMIRGLQIAKARLLDQPLPLVEPTICQTSMNSIDLNTNPISRPTIQFNGYDFNNADLIKVELRTNAGQITELFDRIDRQSDYQYTLDISGMDAQLEANDKLFILFDGKDLSQFTIIKPTAPTIETREFQPTIFEGCPTHIGGDKEFDGHGPNVTASAHIYIVDEKEVWANVYFHLKETVSDWTEAEGEWQFKIWPKGTNTAPAGDYRIDRIISSTVSNASYTDTDHSPDVLNTSGLMFKFVCVGDTGGDDVGNCNGDNDANIKAYFNPVKIELEID